MEKLQVLIIDDDRDIADFFDAVLSLIGHNCEVVQSAKEAFTKLAASDPDLVLLDLCLGSDIGGEDILYQIRSNPRFDHTRVVVITAYPYHAEIIANLADLVLIKPVDVNQLKTLVERMASYDVAPKHSSLRDPVTQLFNREYFISRIELAFDRVQRRPEFLFAVTVIQVNLAGEIESDLHPETWVSLLHEVSVRLKSRLRPIDAIAKFNGWRFGILTEELNKPENLSTILQRLDQTITQPVRIGEATYHLQVKTGYAIYSQHIKQSKELLEAAEQALDKYIPPFI
jgi:diguanylate cyclase (GGDEF)-like protein